MRKFWMFALFVGLHASVSASQQSDSSVVPSQPASVKVYSVEPGVTAPELQPLNMTGRFPEKCKKKMGGKVVLSVLVDEQGRPRNIMFLKPLGSTLDEFALKVVNARDTFSDMVGGGHSDPGGYQGAELLALVGKQVCL